MKSAFLSLGAGLALAVASCAKPPAEVFATGAQTTGATVPIGKNQVGEPCRYRPMPPGEFGVGGSNAVAIMCGSWLQPSGRIFEFGGAADAATVQRLATVGPWRAYIDQRFACGAPTETHIIDGAPAFLLQCTRRTGGWPHVAMTAAVGRRAFAADGVLPAQPAIEATLAALTGRVGPRVGAAASEAEQLISNRTTGAAFGSGDEGRYYELTRAGDAYNNIDDPAHAEQVFREALAVQQHYLAPDNPGLALTMMKLAAQIAHQRNAPEADRLLDNAAKLTARANDPLLAAQLYYYRAVTAAYQGKSADALKLSQAAEQAFSRLLPSGTDTGDRVGAGSSHSVLIRSVSGSGSDTGERGGVGYEAAAPRSRGWNLVALTADTGRTTTEATAIIGLAETLRLRAGLLRLAGDFTGSSALAQQADSLLRSNGFAVSSTGARSLRLLASNDASAGDYSAAETNGSAAERVFAQVVPNEHPVAVSELQQGAYRLRAGDTEAALTLFRKAGKILREPTSTVGVRPYLILPWLDALYATADRTPADRSRLDGDMFEAAQLAEGGLTAQAIAQAAARLAAADPKVGDALRNLQDRQRQHEMLLEERDRLVAEGSQSKDRLVALDDQIRSAEKALADAEAQVQAAAPLYRKTIQETVSAAEVRELLQPDEALLSIFVAPAGSYGFLLEHDSIVSYKIPLKEQDIAGLVSQLRESSQPKAVAGQAVLPNYDIGAAYRLYTAVLGPITKQIEGKSRLTIAASGSLLTFPMGALVTEPNVAVQNGDYRKVPYLLRKFALSYIPAPRTFVDLRRIKTGSPGSRPFIGFGDFRPAADRQIAALFPPERCPQDYRLLRLLGPLPGTKTEVATIGRELGAAAGDIVLGEQFTVARLTAQDLTPYRIIHLATHALLPTELGQCQTAPAILTSVQAKAPSASAGFLGVEEIENLKINADLVVLSACDTAGPGNGAGESLSGLAQAFFRAGTRGMLVTQWAAADVAAMRLMTGALTPGAAGVPSDSAAALRAAQLQMIDTAGDGSDKPLLMSHPYAWAPFVLIGDGVRAHPPGA